MTKRRIKTIEQLRNLPQYRNKSVTELEGILEGILEGKTEEKVEEVLESFEQSYDLSDMSANDVLGLRNLAHYYVYPENINGKTDEALREGNINMVERLIRTAERVQKSITDIQTNLAITRKQRKSDKEQMANKDKPSEHILETDSGIYSVRLRDKGIEVTRDGEVIFMSRGVGPYPKADRVCVKPSFLENAR